MSALLRPRFGALDPSALAKAEAALKSLSGQFDGWIKDEVAKLQAAYAALEAEGVSGPGGESLHGRAHDLKGLGSTYGYPIVTQLAGHLCTLTLDEAARARASLALVGAYVNAIVMVVERGIKSDEDPAGAALLQALDPAAR